MKARHEFPHVALQRQIEEYQGLKRQMDDLDVELKKFRNLIESAVARAEGQKLDVGPYRVMLTEVERESFKLTEAKKALNAKLLAPFITRSVYTRLTIK